MDEINFDYVETFIQSQLDLLRGKLEPRTFEAVNRFLSHAEYEMAFEGMFIDIMKLKEVPAIDFKECFAVAKSLRLDEESVLEEDFWQKFEKYIQENTE
jgi:hypothetical protein